MEPRQECCGIQVRERDNAAGVRGCEREEHRVDRRPQHAAEIDGGHHQRGPGLRLALGAVSMILLEAGPAAIPNATPIRTRPARRGRNPDPATGPQRLR